MSPFPILDQVTASPGQPVGGGRRLLSDRLAARQGQLIDHLVEPIIVAETVETLGEQANDTIPGLSKLRRYSRSLHRQLKWSIDQFHVEHPDRWDVPMRQPGTIASDLIREELCRKPKWSSRPPTPRIVETNPLAGANADPHHENDETKPSCPEPPPANDETKPSVRVELIARLAAAVPPPVAEAAPGFVHDDSNEQIRPVDRPRRANLVLEATRRAKANRRRVALA